MQTSPAQLRAAYSAQPILVAGVFNALSARLAERAGFPALYLSGAAVTTSLAGLPDVGLLTLTEVAQQTRYVSAAVRVPLIVDADTGFGAVVNVERTVRELEAAGAAAIQLEDQRLPKRCGHLSGKDLVEPEEMEAKVRAAVASRRDDRFVIIARTDARGVTGFDDAVARARRYIAAGADVVFPEALESVDEFAAFRRAVAAPLVANMTEFGKSPLLPFDTLAQMGYAMVLFPVTTLRLAMKAVEQGLAELYAAKTQAGLLGRMQSRQELYDLIGYAEYDRRDQQFFRPAGTR
jgi:methylisocitrate lyase